MIDAIDAGLDRLDRWARHRLHDREMRTALLGLRSATGDDFDALRGYVTELRLCPDPMTCEHARP